MATNTKAMILNKKRPSLGVHPGEILQEELKSRGLLQNAFANRIGMQPSHLSALIHGKRNVTPAIAKKLEKELSIPATTWLNLQNLYRLEETGTSKLVHGYASVNEERPQAHYLCACSEEDGFESVRVTLPASDHALLQSMASRLGWRIEVLYPLRSK